MSTRENNKTTVHVGKRTAMHTCNC